MIGQTIGHYRIIESLGKGGMGEVFLATDTKLDRKVAIKFLSSDKASDPESRQRFIHEAKAEAMLSHPNIVTFHEVSEAEGQAFIVMEYVAGQSLPDYVQSQKLSVPEILDLVIQAGEGLQAAHEKGVIHRDIKPDNILVTPKGHVKITDFGLARWKGATTITKTGTRMGTAFYMSPEQAEGRRLDQRSDIFSLGVVLYELLCKQRPFEGESEAVVLYEILSATPQPLARYSRDVPEGLERIVAKCLAKQIDERYQSVADLIADLRHLSRGLDSHRSKSATEEAQTRPSIAVLPFVNMSDDDGNEYFSDGLTEELINALVKIPDLQVAARTSCFQFKGKTGDIDSIGRQLKVARVLEGSVRKAGSRVRITAQLINVKDGFHLWSETYDRDLEDIFAVQDDISQSVARALKVVLIAGIEAAGGARVGNVEAHNLVLEGLHFLRQGVSKRTHEKALRCYEGAIEIDPEYAPAWAGLSKTYMRLQGAGDQTLRECIDKAREAVERALTLDGSLVDAHCALGALKQNHDLDWEGANAEFQKALALEPGNAEALRTAGRLAYATGRLDEAMALLSRGLQLDPLNGWLLFDLGWALTCFGHLKEAATAYRRLLELDPDRHVLHHFLGRVYLLQDRLEAALQEMLQEQNEMWRREGLALAYHALGLQEQADDALRELLSDPRGRHFNIAEVYAYWGDLDNAFQRLEQARLEMDAGVGQFTKTDPLLRNLHSDPRWGVFLQKMGLAD